MALSKQTVYDHHVDEYGNIHIREIVKVIETGGKELARTYHRKVVTVDDDVSNEDNNTKKLHEIVKKGTWKKTPRPENDK